MGASNPAATTAHTNNIRHRRRDAVNRLLLGVVLVPGLLVGGCSKEPAGNAQDSANTADAESGAGLDVKVGGVDVELEKGKGLEVNAPDANVEVGKEGVDVHAPGVDIESQAKQND